MKFITPAINGGPNLNDYFLSKNLSKFMMLKKIHSETGLMKKFGIIIFPFVKNKYFAHLSINLVINKIFKFITSIFYKLNHKYENIEAVTVLRELYRVAYSNEHFCDEQKLVIKEFVEMYKIKNDIVELVESSIKEFYSSEKKFKVALEDIFRKEV